ncbi:DUF4232 domain-containing protein [Streptomyces sp. DT171]|uniref:DUF4232 domain-containing protein n=1 Tax=Streptomyces sp. DT171 TaxID=3416524 RepID=UPI003CF95409
MRTSIRRPAVLAATAVAALGLPLTACGDAGGTRDEGAADLRRYDLADGGAAQGGAGPDASDPGATGATGATASGSGASGATGPAVSATRAGTRGEAVAGAPVCTVDDLRITAAEQEGVPTTHITLTAKNTSGHSCTLLRYPLIAFGDIPRTSKDIAPVAKSRPGVPIVLDPGAPAHASVRINDGGTHGDDRTVTSFHVNLFAADGPTGGGRTVTAPRGGMAVDDAAARTGYWTYELRDDADDF